MLATEVRNNLLVDELQLGTSLNQAVSSGNKAYFNLLLSLLSQDCTDDVSVVDPKQESAKVEDLRAKFHLPKARSFYSNEKDFEVNSKCKDLVDANMQVSLNLTMCLNETPLAVRKEEIPQEILNNLSPLENLKVSRNLEGNSITHSEYDLRTLQIVDAINESRSLVNVLS